MAYCTESDIEKRLPEAVLIELTDDAGAGTVDSDAVDAAIADAGEEIDAYLAMRYSLPFTSTPAIVARMAVDLAVCGLYARRADHVDLPEQWADRCKAHRRMLERMAQGQLKLDVPDPDEHTDHGVEASTSKSDRIFTMGRSSNNTTGTLDNF